MASAPVAPPDPLPLARAWLEEAAAAVDHNPWAMSLATADGTGQPGCRFVLLKELDVDAGFAVFYSNYASRKGAELVRNPRAAGALYWPHAGRQLRLEGIVRRSPATESDAYFAGRPRASQLNAWASEQSSELPADGLGPRLRALEDRYPASAPVPRPEGWGGYRIWLGALEFWTSGDDRFHDRLRYDRELHPAGADTFVASDWRHVRLQP